MTEREAYKQGLSYTGISFESWNKNDKAKAMARVEELRKKYKVRAVLITESNGWQSYYGDANFSRVQYDSVESLNKQLECYSQKLESLENEYKQKLADIEKWKANLENKIEEIKKISK